MEQMFSKVMFSLVPPGEFYPDEDERKEMDELARMREGVFYGTTEVYDENNLKTLLFVVENTETEEVLKLDPTLVKFQKQK